MRTTKGRRRSTRAQASEKSAGEKRGVEGVKVVVVAAFPLPGRRAAPTAPATDASKSRRAMRAVVVVEVEDAVAVEASWLRRRKTSLVAWGNGKREG
jgi:hypothetical protein